jgi:hypothetical protein
MAAVLFLFSQADLARAGVAQGDPAPLPRTGTVQGVILNTVSDADGLFSVRFKVKGRMHEFLIREASFLRGTRSDLQEKATVRIVFKDRELSEMDAFFTATAVTISILKPGKALKAP